MKPLLILTALLLACSACSPLKTAQRLDTSAEKLAELARSDDYDVRLAVAANPNTPPSALDELSQSSSTAIRAAVASNPNTRAGVLERLADDPFTSVQLSAAGSSNLQRSTLERLRKQAEDVTGEARDDSLGNQQVTRFVGGSATDVAMARVADAMLRVKELIEGTPYNVQITHEWDETQYGYGLNASGTAYRERLVCTVYRDNQKLAELSRSGATAPYSVRGSIWGVGGFYLLASMSQLMEELQKTIQ